MTSVRPCTGDLALRSEPFFAYQPLRAATGGLSTRTDSHKGKELRETLDHGDDFLALIAKMSSELYELTNLL